MERTSTELFDSFELDFLNLINVVKGKLEGSKFQTGEKRKSTLRTVEINLDAADENVYSLELEMQGIPQSMRGPYAKRLKDAKTELSRFKNLARDAHTAAARSDLVPSAAGGRNSDDLYGDQRTRLIGGIQTLNDGSRRLADTQRVALQAEEAGAGILQTLRSQRETIEGARDTLQQADVSIDRATGTLKKMVWHMYKQRIIHGAIGVFFALLVVLILYFKLVR